MLVPLGDGVLAVIDAADAEVVSRYRWHAATRGGRVYAAGRLAFAGSDTDKVYLHRLIAQPAKGVEVDHRDGDGLNFRRVNLRHATRGQNAQNTKRRTDNRSGYKGVRMSRRGDRWTARVQGVHIGTFDTAETAALAYDEEARRRFGVFAQTNFTEQD